MNSKVKKNQTEKELDIEKSGISKKATKSKIELPRGNCCHYFRNRHLETSSNLISTFG